MVDEYRLSVDGEEYKTIYTCPHGHNSSYVPEGLKLSNEQTERFRKLKDSGNSLAIAVKIADLTNNSDYTRLGVNCPEDLADEDYRRYKKYQTHYQY